MVFDIFRILGDVSHSIAIGLLLWKIWKTRSCTGVSFKAQIVYMIVFVSRYFELFHLVGWGYSIYNTIMKILFLLTQAAVIIFCLLNKHTMSRSDTFNIAFLIAPSAVLAYFFLDKYRAAGGIFKFLDEYLWTFSILLEAGTPLPLLSLLRKCGEAGVLTTHYVASLGMYRVFYVLHWFYQWLFHSRVDKLSLFAGFIQSVLYADFLYLYYVKIYRNRGMCLPK